MSKRKRRFVSVWLVVSMICAGLALAACGSSNDSSSNESSAGTTSETSATEPSGGAQTGEIDVGTGKPIPLSTENLKIAWIACCTSTPSNQAIERGIKKVTEKYGAEVTTFDANFDPGKQYGLYQNVLSGGDYDVIITIPVEGHQSCEILSKGAPEAGIVVNLLILPICGREFESPKGDGLWQPGTFNIAGPSSTTEGFETWAQACAEETGGEVMLLNGVAGSPNFKTFTKAFEQTDLEIVANYATLYGAPEGLEKTSAALSAHPNLSVIAGQAAELTEGAIQALKAAGKKPGVDVKLCNYTGGTDKMFKLVESGEVTVDNYVNYEWAAIAGTQALFDAIEGKETPRVIVPGQDGEIVKAGIEPWPPVYTKATISEFPVSTGQ